MKSEASLKVINNLYNHVTTLLEIVLIDDEMKSNEFEGILDTIQDESIINYQNLVMY